MYATLTLQPFIFIRMVLPVSQKIFPDNC